MTKQEIDSEGRRNFVAGQLARSAAKFTTDEEWAERRAELREVFLKGANLWPYPEKTPLNPIIHSRRKYDGYSVENIALEARPGFYVTGNVYRPANLRKPVPAILCPHGHFPDGRYRPDQQIRCVNFARMGAIVFSYSMAGYNDSAQVKHKGSMLLSLQTWSSVRIIDYLLNLDEIDPNRIGVTGASGGGTQTLFIALIDERVKVSAPVVIIYHWTAGVDCCECEGRGTATMEASQTNAIELAAAVSPRPQLIVSAGNDLTKDFPDLGFPFIRHVYEIHGESDSVECAHFPDEGHDYGPSKRKAVYDFFARHLDMEAAREGIKTITLEKPEQMAVFDKVHLKAPSTECF